MEANTQEVADVLLRLEEPFDEDEVRWVVAATSRDGRKGRVTPYANPRAYTDRLNEVLTASGWTRQYTVHTISPLTRLKKDQAIQTGKVLVTCTVTIAGIGSHSFLAHRRWKPVIRVAVRLGDHRGTSRASVRGGCHATPVRCRSARRLARRRRGNYRPGPLAGSCVGGKR